MLEAIWHAALLEVDCGHVLEEEAPGVRLGYMQPGSPSGCATSLVEPTWLLGA